MAMINLHPGADATLVNSAYRAAMANVPKDHSQIWQNMATAYQKSMEAVGKAWGDVGTLAAKIAPDVIDYAKQNTKIGQQLQLSQSPIVGELYNDFYQDIQNHWNKKNGGTIVNSDGTVTDVQGWRHLPFGSDERRSAKRKWKKDFEDKMAELNMFESEVLSNVLKTASDQLNIEATGPMGLIWQKAMQKRGDWSDSTENACRVRFDEDTDGKTVIWLEDRNGNAISGMNTDGSFQTVPKLDAETQQYSNIGITMGEDIGQITSAFPDWAAEGLQVKEGQEVSLEFGTDQPITGNKVIFDQMQKNLNKLPDVLKTIKPDKSKTLDIQKALQNLNYNIDYEKDGETVTGEAAADGNWGNATQAAWNAFQQDVSNMQTIISRISTKPFTINAEEIKNVITTQNSTTRAALNKIDLDVLKGELAFRPNAIKNQILETLGSDRNAWNDAFHARLGNMDKTYAQMLTSPSELSASVFESLKNLGATDIDADGDVDADDFIGNSSQAAANMQIMTHSLLDPTNPLAQGAFADWYTSHVANTSRVVSQTTSDYTGGAGGTGGGRPVSFSKENAAIVLSGNDPSKNINDIGSLNVKSLTHNLKIGKGEISFNNDFMSKVTGREIDSKSKGYSFDYKIGSDGIIYHTGGPKGKDDPKYGKEWQVSDINEHIEHWNKLVEYLNDNGINSAGLKLKYDETDKAAWRQLKAGSDEYEAHFTKHGINEEYAGDIYNALTYDFDDINKTSKYWGKNESGDRETSGYLFSYSNDDFVAETLNNHYGHLGFTFTNPSWRYDGIKVEYTYKHGRNSSSSSGDKVSQEFETNFVKAYKDYDSAELLISWMKERLKYDYGWVGSITNNIEGMTRKKAINEFKLLN